MKNPSTIFRGPFPLPHLKLGPLAVFARAYGVETVQGGSLLGVHLLDRDFDDFETLRLRITRRNWGWPRSDSDSCLVVDLPL